MHFDTCRQFFTRNFFYFYYILVFFSSTLIQQVETCQEKIISLELEDPKSLESPLSPTTEEFINAQLKQRLRMSSEESDDKDSMVTVRPNSSEDNFILQPTDPEDFINANIVTASEYHDEDDVRTTSIQTIVEVVNPLLAGDGTATEIAIGKSANVDISNLGFDDDDDDIDSVEVVYRNEMSLNDKMKNVLRELKENEKVRLSLSRSMEEEEGDDVDGISRDVNDQEGDADEVMEKQGANGTVFMVRERLINDFYDHPLDETSEDVSDVNMASVETGNNFSEDDPSQATIFVNPSAVNDEFLANEIRHAQETSSGVVENNSLRARKEALTLDLNRTIEAGDGEENDEDGEDDETTTPTTPTKDSTTAAAGKRRRRKNKNKKK